MANCSAAILMMSAGCVAIVGIGVTTIVVPCIVEYRELISYRSLASAATLPHLFSHALTGTGPATHVGHPTVAVACPFVAEFRSPLLKLVLELGPSAACL